MWELDCEESWAPKNWCFWTVVLEKTLENPLDHKEIQTVLPKGDQSWVFIGRSTVEAETPVLWPPRVKSWLIGKDPNAGEDWGQEEKDDRGWDGWMASPTRWTWVWVDLEVDDGQRGLECCDSWGSRVGHDWATEPNPGLFYLENRKRKKILLWKSIFKGHLWLIHVETRVHSFCR